ncbi:hypothetical protein ACFW34_11940 [Streptomyces sp. NPDC058848]|uniref:hypothetical protein n=1 Tax=unclassified Streptomyces TaxID=2593676 RepID=UPI0036D1E730
MTAARLLGVVIVALPLISLALLGLGRAGQALAHHTRNTMSHAQRTARACRITAAVLAITAALLAYEHWAYALPGVIGAGVFLSVADSYRRDEQRQRARHAALHAAAAADEQVLPTNTDHRSAA